MSTLAPLSADYTTARAEFLAAVSAAGADLQHHPHPARGPDGAELAIDVATFGARDAPKVLLVMSGTHGVEGFAGSALQREWSARHSRLPADVRVELVHGFNPFGFAWVRRANEDNVDLNRNFIDWSAPTPQNPDYDRMADLLVPQDWSQSTQRQSTEALLELAGELGMERMQAAVSGGQYAHPNGMYFGGAAPVWSNRWIHTWGATRLAGVSDLAVIDLHTGLGPWGHGELISSDPAGSESYERATSWWGEVHSLVDGESVSARLSGDWLDALGGIAPSASITAITLEFGTVDMFEVLQALRADAWLHAHGDPSGPDALAIRAQLRRAFADDDPAWLDALWARFAPVVDAALAQLGFGSVTSSSASRASAKRTS